MLNLAARFSSSFRSAPGPVSPQSSRSGTRADSSGRATPLRERSVVVGPKSAFKAFVRAVIQAGRHLLGRSVQQILPEAAARTPLRLSTSAIPPAAQQIVQREITNAVRREKPVDEAFTLRSEDGQTGSTEAVGGAGSQPAEPGREEATVKQAIEALLSECLGADPKARRGRAATAEFLGLLVRAQLKEAGPAEHAERVLRGSVERAREEFEAMIDEVADSSMLDRACAAVMRRIGTRDSTTTDDWIAAVTDEVAAVRNKASLADAAEAELRAAIGTTSAAAGPDLLKAMARFVAERISTAPASVSSNSMKPAVDEAVRLLQEFTATERLHPTQRHEEGGASKQIDSHFDRMQIAARDGRFEARLAALRQDLAKQVIRRMVSVGASGQPGAPEGWLRKLLKEERPSLLPSEPMTKPAAPDAGRIEAPVLNLRAQRRLLQQSGDLTSLLRKIDREIAPAMMSRLALAMDAQPTRPLHELVIESEASLREAALACLPQSTQAMAA